MNKIKKNAFSALILGSAFFANITMGAGVATDTADLETPTLRAGSAYSLTDITSLISNDDLDSDGNYTGSAYSYVIKKYLENEDGSLSVAYFSLDVKDISAISDDDIYATEYAWDTKSSLSKSDTGDFSVEYGTYTTPLYGVAGDIDANFVGLFSTDNTKTDVSSTGGAIYLYYNGGISSSFKGFPITISGNFVNNYASKAGGAIYLQDESYSINASDESISYLINANFIANTSEENGGAIYVYAGSISSITGDFISNSTKSYGGGAIYNASSKGIGTITGDFISNSGVYYGGAIYNNNSTIETITGDFIENFTYSTGMSYIFGGGGGAIFNTGSITSIGGSFIGNSATGDIYSYWGDLGGGAIYNSGSIKTISGEFVSNSISSNCNALGGAIYNSGDIETITGKFVSNSTSTNGNYYWTAGGAIYNDSDEVSVNADFDSNYTKATSGYAEGGAIYNDYGNMTVEGNFTNNYAVGLYTTGGAVTVYDGEITFTANSSNIYNVGNWAGTSKEAASDENGGFLYMDASTVTFDVSADYTMTIGDGTANQDSIAGDGSISKIGDGELTVNSSMEFYEGSLSVDNGSMSVNNVLGATSITIESGATLTLGVSDYMDTEIYLLTGLTSDDSISGAGTLNLVANVGANVGDYYTSTGEITFTNVYGGTLDGNVFTVAATNTSLTLTTEATVTISAGSRVAIATSDTDDSTAVYLAFSSTESTSGTLNSVSDESDNADFITAYSAVEGTTSDIISGAYYFDFTDLDVDSVLVSLYVGDDSLSVYDFTIYHYDSETGWDTTSDLRNISYDGEYLSFEVTHFSGYGYSATSTSTIAVPEPSTYALIIGFFSLGFVAYRRRK